MCTDCANGHYSTTGLTACLECPTGKYARLAHSYCFHCPAGKFQDSTTGSNCDDCEPGTAQADLAQGSCDGCTPGHYQALSGESVCKNCPEGKYQANWDKAFCDECEIARFVVGPAAAICTACPVGKYQAFKGRAVCTPCRTCQAGKYLTGCGNSFPNNSNQGDCLDCDAGKFKDNYYTWDRMCEDCLSGEYAPTDGHSTCLQCPGGKYARVGHTFCFICPRGKWALSVLNTQCTNCDTGRHAPAPESESCDGCPAGKHQNLDGKYFCHGCVSGTYQNLAGQNFCAPCPTCESSQNAATSCYSLARDCEVSQWSTWGTCDQTCAEGTATRTRTVVTTDLCGGNLCSSIALTSTADCMLRPCDCSHVTCNLDVGHSCTDYTHGSIAGWQGITSSNKGNDYNNGFNVKVTGHHTNAGACATVDASNCHDLDHLSMNSDGQWVASEPTDAEFVARHRQYYATCAGTHTSIRVAHDRAERKFTSGGNQHIEGHHCKMMDGTCKCRCHRMFRHNFFPGALRDYNCPVGKHVYQEMFLGGSSELCIDDSTEAAGSPVLSAHYNPLSCDNTDSAVTQPTGHVSRTGFADGSDLHINVQSAWHCKEDNSRFDFNFSPKERVITSTPAPTAYPTPNPCADGSHLCDNTEIQNTVNTMVNDYNGAAYAAGTKLGFCLVDTHAGHVCGCIREHKLNADGKTCDYSPSDTAGNGNRL